MVLAGAVLFVACANVAGLLASRAPMRAREVAMRLAIGAGRRRVVRQLITESMLIAFAGGLLGLGVGYAAVRLFSQIQIPMDLPIIATFSLDRRVLLFSVAVAVVSAALFGLAPALRAGRTDLTAVMKANDAAGFGRRRQWGRRVLVGGQVAIAVVLLVVATFIYRGFQKQLTGGPGFRTDHLLMMSVAPKQLRYSEEQSRQFFERLAAAARLTPGVTSATVTRYMPMDGIPPSITIVPEGFQFPAGQDSVVHGQLDRGRALLRNDRSPDSAGPRVPGDRRGQRANEWRSSTKWSPSATGDRRTRSGSAFVSTTRAGRG